jgi:excisionase family DNA binding protein
MITQTNSEAEQQSRSRRRAMSIAEFCGRYGPSRTTTYELIKQGRLRARKIGKRTIITEDDAEDFLRCLPTMVPDNTAQGHHRRAS